MFNFKLNLLGIKDDNAVIDDYFQSDSGEVTLIISLKRTQQFCPTCGSVDTIIHSSSMKKIIHSYSTEYPCNILYHQKRFICKDCQTTFNEVNNFVLGYNRISDLTINCILKDLKTTDSYKNIADRYHVSSQTVLNYMDKYIDPKRRQLPEILCIDEFKNLSFGKGKYACLLLDYQTGTIIDVLPNRRLDSLLSYLNLIPIEEKRNVKYVVSDMYDGYKHLATTSFPKATLVIDAFHYIRYISEALNKVRRRICEQFSKTSKEYLLLKKYWKLLSKDSSKLDNPFKIRKWNYINEEMNVYDFIQVLKNTHPDIKTAYLLKEDFFSSYKKVDYDHADSYLSALINSMINSNLPEFIELADTFKNWFPFIVNSFNKDEYGKRMSNGKIEGSNNKIKVIKRVSYGYSDFYHLRNRIMYVFNEDEEPRVIPKSKEKIKIDKIGHFKPRKKKQK